MVSATTTDLLDGPASQSGSWYPSSFRDYFNAAFFRLACIREELIAYAQKAMCNSLDVVMADLDAGYSPVQCAARFERAANAMLAT